jgi:hypothetical protein
MLTHVHSGINRNIIRDESRIVTTPDMCSDTGTEVTYQPPFANIRTKGSDDLNPTFRPLTSQFFRWCNEVHDSP